ncbi:bifunctional phosphoribosyl-AMP cyclohydrolase/phosphoribosyl-ATP diphosphatase HisIE [Staphylococcus lutrae]|uniref:Histidine biosynthesis bifunctional protein HisIE n=1 Tax=Staphylococcus lutrae TaxID=155085 RepID=A0AAC9RTR0_9STAP|nr:bifunctional phosphoribosyl-AMP cyclohydrolase/phosphoribosyl-ATP diphosphatase HisIE [Staphylococcus lutrae]ARJ50682.1 bifunctional phosphoribosyl-AMP cyclohydrolase/phosphoribosyl-ATP diphosphatase [Staphylococcus lutrae]PNZ34730.1 bifunctional phosphoribosyl-AMP cyclohydrolase/phosphoribosyl-ATP diphosphatase HisIE [Staphylococcus lutrae]
MVLKPDFSKGLLPVILQDATTKQVLMLGYMNEEAFQKTVDEKVAWFYSRSKQRLWKKGETSGHIQKVEDMYLDCDQDTLLLFVTPMGPTCHTGKQSCFGTSPSFAVQHLESMIQQRAQTEAKNSYTQYLLREGKEKISKKLGEEAFEVVIAAMKEDRHELIAESADLLYHLFVLLHNQNTSFEEVEHILADRHHVRGNFKGERQDIEVW